MILLVSKLKWTCHEIHNPDLGILSDMFSPYKGAKKGGHGTVWRPVNNLISRRTDEAASDEWAGHTKTALIIRQHSIRAAALDGNRGIFFFMSLNSSFGTADPLLTMRLWPADTHWWQLLVTDSPLSLQSVLSKAFCFLPEPNPPFTTGFTLKRVKPPSHANLNISRQLFMTPQRPL